ncbi:MAG TPA: RNA polymerase sigma-70 factor [Chloroflexota bacterium]|nr:RNA polymerase sigma-70 factor [Chloroflexota bacterium]
MDAVAVFAEERPKLFGVAYRMLGSVADAEDVIQETFLRWQEVMDAGTAVESPSAYLTTMVSRRCLDELRSARRRREEYVGEWLPEPLLEDDRLDPAATTELADSLSTAFLVVLEALSPGERAAFLLHDVFGYEYAELARILGRGEPACRQLVARARRRVAERRPRFDVSPEVHARLLNEFMYAATAGDVDGLVSLLAQDAVLTADGGGVVTAARNPIAGADRIARWSIGVLEKTQWNVSFEVATVNGLPGAVMRVDGTIYGVMSIEVRDGKIQNVYIQVNPAKLPPHS